MAGKIAGTFINSKLTALLVGAAILLGAGAIMLLPREEEPQIVVPMVDLFVQMPGATAKEVEERVTGPIRSSSGKFPGLSMSTRLPVRATRWLSSASMWERMRRKPSSA